MTIILLRPYATFAQGATVNLDNATEASLVAQGRATYTVNPGPFFESLTATEQQTLRDGAVNFTAEQVAATQAIVSDAGIRAYHAWRAQPKTYKLVPVPAPTHYINSVTGLDANAGTSPALAKQTISPAFLTTLPAGSCIALSNNSLFDLTDRISFAAALSVPVNGASETSRITFTNYDPGGFPTQRPRVRFRYVPTTVQWTWDAGAGAWYYTNPNARPFAWSALIRMGGRWGINFGSSGFTAATFPKIDFASWPSDGNSRMYVWSPQAIDPTTYYGGTGSVIIGEGSSGALQFSRSGKFVTIDNIVFEECGCGVYQPNVGATEALPGLVIQNCWFLNSGVGVGNVGDNPSLFTSTTRLYNNVFIGIGSNAVHSYNKALNWEIAGNYFKQGNQSASYGGFIYAQEQAGGTTAHGNNIAYENYFEDAKFNTSLFSNFDGCAFYAEERAKGWTCTRNFFAKMHAGVQNNSGEPLITTHNVFDDVDCPLAFYDAGNTNTVSVTFLHNTCLNIGLTKYRPPGSLDPAQAAIGAGSNIDAGSLVVRNNLFQFTNGGAVIRPRAGLTVTGTDNQVFGATGVLLNNSVPNAQGAITDLTQYQANPAGTDTTEFTLDPISYVPVSGVSAGVAISTLPTPVDLYGIREPLPSKGAVTA